MFMRLEIRQTQYLRPSKKGVQHSYQRKKTVAIFVCDNCECDFERELKNINRKRLSDNYFHCCGDCDYHRFAQRKGIERKKIWDMPAGTDLPVSKY
jgi:hypothetical protein